MLKFISAVYAILLCSFAFALESANTISLPESYNDKEQLGNGIGEGTGTCIYSNQIGDGTGTCYSLKTGENLSDRSYDFEKELLNFSPEQKNNLLKELLKQINEN